jgi:hypothetical protein
MTFERVTLPETTEEECYMATVLFCDTLITARTHTKAPHQMAGKGVFEICL